jgi:hypothetical protein
MNGGGSGSPDGDPGGKGDEVKTRFVPRNDVLDRSQPAASPREPSPPAEAIPPGKAGTVIGRTRLVGDHGQATQGSGGRPTTPDESMVQPRTEYMRSENLEVEPVAGWVIVVSGPGRGGFRPVFVGMNSVGRDTSQRVCLNFGDETISRQEHAFITYDEEQRCFFLQHGGKSNLVRLAGKPVLSPVELQANASIRIGRTTLRFIPCCGPDFSWGDEVAEA